MKNFCVIGSLNYDMILRCQRFPESGETIFGMSFLKMTGGKGGNQAVTLAKLGASVTFLGAVGTDALGNEYIEVLNGHSISTERIRRDTKQTTGVAMIEVNDSGQNRILVVSGANATLDNQYLVENKDVLSTCSIFLLQGELPCELNIRAKQMICSTPESIIIFDAAPATNFPPEIYNNLEYITCNEGETKAITGIAPDSPIKAKNAAEWFLAKGVHNVIIKIGPGGVYFFNNKEKFHCPAFSVPVVADTTGAGDAFNGGFAYALGLGYNHRDAVKFGQAVSAIAITREGAQASLPDYKTVMDIFRLEKIDYTEI
jgi:ribokinase